VSALLFPAIDLLEGRAVRLQRGERASAKIYAERPEEQARAFVAEGAQVVHVVDLDAAFGGARQLALIDRIARAAAPALVQVGGGLRDLASAQETLSAGAGRVILGTAAVERPALAGEAVARFGADRVAVGVDVKDGRAATRGWTEARGPTAPALAATLLQQGVQWLVVTAVARDGMLGGFDLDLLREVASAAPGCKLVASGGAGSLDHLRALAQSGLPIAGAIAGTALYEGKFSVADGIAALAMAESR
jgi:phosphoribosylformimino-5-aminoimidazole carboxamide ribotide isomerase